ncbi:MAG: 50S ribosomal protein L25 [Treponema sp.]|jgi:large subunit ribosomal protein L25|nr:50S ribosomal protein L25 [Treponema sp.]
MMEQMVVTGVTRTETGKRAAKKLRKTGKLPAVMYNSRGEAVSLTIDEAEFSRVWRNSTPTTLIHLMVDNQDMGIAFIKDTEYDIKTDKSLHVDFHVIEKDKPLEVAIKVQYTGTSAGVREGGRLNNHYSQVTIKCLPKDLPPRIVADISSLGIGATLRVKDLSLDSGITAISDAETLLVSVTPAA